MKSRNSFKTLNELYHTHDSKQFWKLVRRRRLNGNDPSSDINLQTLVDHYTKKFAPPRNINDTIRSSQQCVDDKINNLTLHDQQITQTMAKRYICKLKLNCSPANDGITAEHLLYGIDSNIPHQATNMLSLCIKYCVVPEIFTNGMLVPIPKFLNQGATLPILKTGVQLLFPQHYQRYWNSIYWKKVLIIISAIPNLDL